jgi:hypothetical protein
MKGSGFNPAVNEFALVDVEWLPIRNEMANGPA